MRLTRSRALQRRQESQHNVLQDVFGIDESEDTTGNTRLTPGGTDAASVPPVRRTPRSERLEESSNSQDNKRERIEPSPNPGDAEAIPSHRLSSRVLGGDCRPNVTVTEEDGAYQRIPHASASGTKRNVEDIDDDSPHQDNDDYLARQPPAKKARSGILTPSAGAANGYDQVEAGLVGIEGTAPGAKFLPNDLTVRALSNNAFQYQMLSGHELVITHHDVFFMSLERFTSEATVLLAADIILRENNCEPGTGSILMYETEVIERYCTKKTVLENRKLSMDRMETLLSSKVLFVPIHTTASRHWSLLVILNCNSLKETILPWRSKNGLLTALGKDLPKPMAIHFDSLQSSTHAASSKNIMSLLCEGLTSLWKKKNAEEFRRRRIAPSAQSLVMKELRFVSAKVQQQTDGVTCGWRTVDAIRFVAEHCRGTPNWKAIVKKDVPSDCVRIARRCLLFAQRKCAPTVSNIPSVLFPLHALVDEVCCSAFEADMSNINQKMVTYFDENRTDPSKANSKKVAQGKKFKEIFESVATKMVEKGLHKRKKVNRTVEMSLRQRTVIANHIIAYPRGSQYAKCLYYTRYNYPDSILLCTGLNVLLESRPRVFGHDLYSGSGRMTKAEKVVNKMAVFLDFNRSVARHWDVVARFRLQELVLHFTGIAEAVLKSCAREARRLDRNHYDGGEERRAEQEEGYDSEKDVNVIPDNSDEPWTFDNSISIEIAPNENGQIRCGVVPNEIASAIVTCLNVADRVANQAITGCLSEFQEICKRVIQLSDRTIKLSDVPHRVTGSAMAAIPITFSKSFSTALLDKVKDMWGHLLPATFMETSLRPLVSQLLRTANEIFVRNGKIFLGITEEIDLFNDSRIVASKKKEASRKQKDGKTVSKVKNVAVEASDGSVEEPVTTNTVVKNVWFSGLGSRTVSHHHRSTTEVVYKECLAIFFYLLKGCKVHRSMETYHCREYSTSKWGNDLPECQYRLEDVWNCFRKSVEKLGKDFAAISSSHELKSFEDHLKNLRFDCVVRMASKIADTRDSHAGPRNRSSALRSDIFCYNVPRSHRGDMRQIAEGGQFVYYYNVEQDVAIWHGTALEISCNAIASDQAGIYVSGEKGVIGDFPIEGLDAPKLFSLTLSVRVESSVDLWTNARNIVGHEENYLGFRKDECVRVVFSFNDGAEHTAFPNPLTGNYTHSMLAVVSRHPTEMAMEETRGERRNRECVGPRHVLLDVIVQDDVTLESGVRATLPDLVSRWEKRNCRYSLCYVMPLEGLSLTRDLCEYQALGFAHKLAKPHIFAILDPNMASAYEEERRKQQYNVMSLTNTLNPLERLSFSPLHRLEKENRSHIRGAVAAYDNSLNAEQIAAIQCILYGWKTRLAPNGSLPLDECSSEVKQFLRDNGCVSPGDLKWWGSRSCFIQGPPGTGKTRMMAALIAVLLEEAEGKPRVMVACETNRALDEIFVKVLNLFKRRRACYERVLKSMVRIGSSSVHVVQKRQAQGSYSEVDRARVVFTTFGSSHRAALQNSVKPFSVVLIEEACRVSEGMALQGICTATLRRGLSLERDFNRVVLAVVGDQKQLHETVTTRFVVPKRVRTHFFDRVWDANNVKDCYIRIMLTKQYRMNPALARFVSDQFYDGKLTTPEDGQKPWNEDNFFTTLRGHGRFPVRNMVVIDTSLEERAAVESLGMGRSYFNVMEAKLIQAILTEWSASHNVDEVMKKVIVVTTYSRQRSEIQDRLRAAGLNGVNVATIDELQGGEREIVILSLVRGCSSPQDDDTSYHHEEFPPSSKIGFVSNAERINVALSRAKQGVVVIGYARYIARHSSVWRKFFKTCLEKSSGAEDKGTHGYFRLRYVDFDEDVHLAPFTPPYIK